MMSPLGTKRPNLMMLQDYVQSPPIPTFRLELDIPLNPPVAGVPAIAGKAAGGRKAAGAAKPKSDYEILEGLLDKADQPGGGTKIIKFLLSRLGNIPAAAAAREKKQHIRAAKMIRAAFS